MIVTFVVSMIVALMVSTSSRFLSVLVMPGVVTVAAMAFMEDLRLLPLVAFTGNSGEEQTSGEQVKRFHLRRV